MEKRDERGVLACASVCVPCARMGLGEGGGKTGVCVSISICRVFFFFFLREGRGIYSHTLPITSQIILIYSLVFIGVSGME